MRTLLSFFASLWLALPVQAQVQSRAYNAMLRTLLSHSVPEVSATQAAKSAQNTIFLDAREPREYAVSHLRHAVFVGYDHFDANLVQHLDKTQPIVVYCSVGYRSERIAERLRAQGFSQVSNLYGGIFEWVNAGFPVWNANGPTEDVHAYNRTWGVWLKKGKKVYQ